MRFLTLSHYAKRRQDLDHWRDFVLEGLERIQFPERNLTPELADGTNVVFRLGDSHFIKIYSPFVGGRGSALVEPAALKLLTPHMAVPKIVARGELDPEADDWQWPFIVTEAIPGAPLSLFWSRLDEDDRIEWCAKLGELVRTMHRAGPGGELPLAYQAAEPGGFRGFLYRRYEQARRETAIQLLETIDEALLDELALDWGVALHGDLEGDHLFVSEGEFSGIIDFGDAKVGDSVYEWVSLATDVFQRKPGRGEAFMAAYGAPPDDFFRRLGAYAFLHEWHDADARMRLAQESGAQDIDALGRWLWGY